ncbi:cell adhesion molecule CEACAM8-like isoform X2 [Ranitomeya variabilis]|uniref:cell adhesion molecule CEACAM8-like isoform X2 n=1 Tax=Ranitomeya variabilis TaxID=490064 RepID=UPI004056538A
MIDPQGRHKTMRGFLISVLLVITMDVTSGQISIRLIPQYPVTSGSITLSITGINAKLELVAWYKGADKTHQNQILTYVPGNSPPILVPGLLHNDRISVINNGSLHIKDLCVTDGGNYIVAALALTSALELNVNLTVYEGVTKPRITASLTQLKEKESFTLTCNLTCNTVQATTIRWTRNGASVPSGAKLSGDSKTLTFSSVKRGDAGEYRCEAQNLVSDLYPVTVAYGPDKVQMESASFVRPGSSITLTCSADSVPPPEYQWKLNGTDIQEKSSKYAISNAAPEDEGLYTCVAKNTVTLRTATDSVYVNVTAEYIEDENSTGLIIGLTIGAILGGVLIIIISVFLYRKILTKKKNESSENRKDHVNVYENVTATQPKEESSYMGLQFRTENTYAELKT